MKISKKKEEILELLGKLIPKGQSPAPSGERSKPPARRDLGELIANRRRTLAEIRDRREKLGIDLLEERLLSICKMLEERTSKIERILESTETGAQPTADRGAAPPGQDLDTMFPDLNIASGTVIKLPEPDQGVKVAAKSPSARNYMLAGKIEDQTLPDIIQMVSSNKKSGIFALEKDDLRVELFFREGTLFHASAGGDMTGPNAFYSAMAMGSGRFFFEETDKLPQEKSIDGNTQFMILEALRQIDEQRGG